MTQALLLAAVESGEPSRLVTNLALLVVAGFVGYAVISKVPNTLHTPLMSGTNAIHGVVILGGLVLLAGSADLGVGTSIILFVALLFGAINVVGGFVVTDRMLEMFKAKPAPPKKDEDEKEGDS
ncbi:MAG: NAD(P) transhydrogenase subunit alpha [Actinomycetota bacterium]|jgi:NAD(P) transhydrogenase subunit alpha|nr:NAD(P) transhydrogenase subunit alpha [Actinomycetota bacterium]MDQ3408723.1 NAD(P) transhydrogenase subunit alpha [Actinomycetota bacterium]